MHVAEEKWHRINKSYLHQIATLSAQRIATTPYLWKPDPSDPRAWFCRLADRRLAGKSVNHIIRDHVLYII